MRDYSKLIGIPFKYGGRTYENLDCYGLVVLLYKEFHNIDVPEVVSPSLLKEIHDAVSVETQKWERCELHEGAVIVFSIKGYGAHVAYYIGDDRIIHTWEATGGVTIERLGIHWKHRVLGIYKWNPKN